MRLTKDESDQLACGASIVQSICLNDKSLFKDYVLGGAIIGMEVRADKVLWMGKTMYVIHNKITIDDDIKETRVTCLHPYADKTIFFIHDNYWDNTLVLHNRGTFDSDDQIFGLRLMIYNSRTSTDFDYVVFLCDQSKSIIILKRTKVKDQASKYLGISILPEDIKGHSFNLNAVKRFVFYSSTEMMNLLKTDIDSDSIRLVLIQE